MGQMGETADDDDHDGSRGSKIATRLDGPQRQSTNHGQFAAAFAAIDEAEPSPTSTYRYVTAHLLHRARARSAGAKADAAKSYAAFLAMRPDAQHEMMVDDATKRLAAVR